MTRMGVSGRMFILVPAHPGSLGQRAVKWLCLCVWVYAEEDWGYWLTQILLD